MTKHTPGPWTIHQDSDGWLQVMSGGASGRIVANVNAESCPSVASRYLPVVMPADANARLIADAPDMLAALEAICEHANEAWAALDHDYHEVLAGNLGDAVDQARAVISKAKGESE